MFELVRTHTQQPIAGFDYCYVGRDVDYWWPVECNQHTAGQWEFTGGVLQRSDFPGEGARMVNAGANLDQLFMAIDMAAEKINLEALGCAHICEFGAASNQLQKYGGFKGVAEVGLARTVEDRDLTGIDGIDLAGINPASTFRVGGYGKAAHQEGILQMTQIAVQSVFANSNAL